MTLGENFHLYQLILLLLLLLYLLRYKDFNPEIQDYPQVTLEFWTDMNMIIY